MSLQVENYVESRNFEDVDEIKRDILSLYRNDIHKYADKQELKVTAIFDEIPGQLMEIDFLISKPVTTSRHNISPIEVKSGNKFTLTSLKKCIAKYGNQLSTPYVVYDKDLKEEDGIVYLPLYMSPLL